MSKTASCLVTLLLGMSVLVAPPAQASFGALVELPGGKIYSPFGGPATVTFTFDGGDSASVFTVRLRKVGGGTIKEKDYLVDPSSDTSPHQVAFSWPNITVEKPTDYIVSVHAQSGGAAITSEGFTLLPKLVSELSANPTPFYPLIRDGYKDETRVGFSLAAYTSETVARVFRPDAYGRCCGGKIRQDELGPLAKGSQRWVWNGKKDDGSTVAKGTYFIKIEATDKGAVTRESGALKVEVTKGWIRVTGTRKKVGSAYSRTANEQQTALGGDCLVSRDTTAKTANILCANAAISIIWKWALEQGERIESVSFVLDEGIYGCHRTVSHSGDESIMRVTSPPTSTCTVFEARMKYSYPVQV